MRTWNLRRIGALCAIFGTLITGVSNGMHPELAEPTGIVRNAATSSGWTSLHWGLIIGMTIMQLGYLAALRTLQTSGSNEARHWGSLSAHFLTLGLALWISVFTAEAAMPRLSALTHGDHSGALALASFVDSTATAATLVYWLGISLLGLALLASHSYPSWIGISGLILGASISLSVGVLKAFTGASAWTERYGFQTLAALFLTWTIVLGAFLWREKSNCTETPA